MVVNRKNWELYLQKKLGKFKQEELKVIRSVLDDLHPERYELNLQCHDINSLVDSGKMTGNPEDLIKNTTLECIIHYPIINIKNRNNLKHVIRDLYVKITFPLNNPNAIIDLDGVRATISKNEYSNGYAHSHLPRSSFYHFNNFCVGSSEMGCCIQSEFITTNKASIYQFLFLLQSYLEYESIEGVPYIRLETCRDTTDIPKIKVEDYILDRLKEVKLPIKLNKHLKITNIEEIELLLAKKCHYPVTKLDGKYYSILSKSNISSIQELDGRDLFQFKGNKIKLTIDNYATETECTKYCHPKYRDAVIRYWENKILQTHIRNNRTIRQNTVQNLQESNEPSEVLM